MWDSDLVQSDDITERGPRIVWDECVGDIKATAFREGRRAFKNNSRYCRFNGDILRTAFWDGWKWQKRRGGGEKSS